MDKDRAMRSLGLASVIRPQRSLDELAELDLSSGVKYPKVDELTANKSLTDNSAQVATPNPPTSRVGSENIVTQLKMRLPNGKMVRVERRIIADLSKVVIYPGNPNAKQEPDITNLTVKVASTGGNITPVTARDLPNGLLEVIAGSRRTRAVRQAEVTLIADVILDDIDDDQANQLAWIENDRSDPDYPAMAMFYSNNYSLATQKKLITSIAQFADIYHMTETNMGRYLRVGALPTWILNLCPRYKPGKDGEPKSVWTLRKCDELATIYVKNQSAFTDEVQAVLRNSSHRDPSSIIAAVRNILGAPKQNTSVQEFKSDKGLIGTTEFGVRKNTMKLTLTEDAPQEMKDEIIAVLKKYTQN